jgi:hypothetical protein
VRTRCSVALALPVWLEQDSLAGATWQAWVALGAARAAQFINLVPPIAVQRRS